MTEEKLKQAERDAQKLIELADQGLEKLENGKEVNSEEVDEIVSLIVKGSKVISRLSKNNKGEI